MAKNYTFAEAVAIINEGKDLEAIADIGRRYPVLMHKVTKVATLAGADFVDLMGFMPDYLTANKVNTALKAVAAGGSAEDADAADTDEDEAPSAPETAEAPRWDESMSAKQLWDILGKAGKRKLAKSTKKADLVEACKQAFGAPAAVEADEDEADADAETEAEAAESNPYEGKSAMDLFKECKKRGIKAASRKPAKYYADLLVKADAEAAEAETESDEEDWEDEPAEEPKAAAKTEKKPAKKSGKKAEKPAADDDDDWDI